MAEDPEALLSVQTCEKKKEGYGPLETRLKGALPSSVRLFFLLCMLKAASFNVRLLWLRLKLRQACTQSLEGKPSRSGTCHVPVGLPGISGGISSMTS